VRQKCSGTAFKLASPRRKRDADRSAECRCRILLSSCWGCERGWGRRVVHASTARVLLKHAIVHAASAAAFFELMLRAAERSLLIKGAYRAVRRVSHPEECRAAVCSYHEAQAGLRAMEHAQHFCFQIESSQEVRLYSLALSAYESVQSRSQLPGCFIRSALHLCDLLLHVVQLRVAIELCAVPAHLHIVPSGCLGS